MFSLKDCNKVIRKVETSRTQIQASRHPDPDQGSLDCQSMITRCADITELPAEHWSSGSRHAGTTNDVFVLVTVLKGPICTCCAQNVDQACRVCHHLFREWYVVQSGFKYSRIRSSLAYRVASRVLGLYILQIVFSGLLL
jgi:hypothetical protein